MYRQFEIVLRKLRCARYISTNLAGLDFEKIPSPRGLPLVGTTLSLLASGGATKLHEYVEKRHKQLGPVYKDTIGPLTAVFLSDAEMIRSVFAQEGKYPRHIKPEPWMIYNEKHNYTRGLFFMDGEKWLHFRRILNRILLKGDLTWIEFACEAATDLLLKRLLFHSEGASECPNLEKELYRWSADVIVSVLVGAESYKQFHDTIDRLMAEQAVIVQSVFETTSKLSLVPAAVAAKYNIPQWRRFESTVSAALKSVNQLVDILMEKFLNGAGLLSKLKEEGVDEVEIKRIVADLVLAGGDTTAYTMEWMLYLAAKNKAVQEKLRGDDTTLYRNVLKETLRLYPVATLLNRILPDAATIGGYTLPAGTLVVMSIYSSGRDERYFKNAADFLPDRWLRDSTGGSTSVQQASLPFGMGARSCIGKKIAEAQLQTALSKIVRNFDIELCNEKDLEIVVKMVAKPSEPLKLRFKKIV